MQVYPAVFFLSLLLASLHPAAAATYQNTPLHLSSHQELPQRPISFSPPSQNPILTYPPTLDGSSPIRGTVDVSFYGLHEPVPVAFSFSSQVCEPLVQEVPYIITDLSQRMLSEHLDDISFPFSSDSQTPTLPIYLVANITEHIYRSKFVLSLSLKLSPLESGLKGVGPPGWQAIIGLLEQSTQEVGRVARKRNGAGLGSVVVLEAEMDEVYVLAEWRFWRIVDGLAVICED